MAVQAADDYMMLETIAGSSFGFWIIALLIVVLDAVVLLAPGEFAFVFDRRGQPKVRITGSPYLIRNQELLLALRFFGRLFFISSANAPELGEPQLLRMRDIGLRQRSINAYAVVALALVIGIGPALSVAVGISAALLTVLPILYTNAIVAVIDVAATRKCFNVPARSLLFLAFEFIVCPALVANLNKRLIDRRVMSNTFQLLGGDRVLLARIKSNLEFHNLAVRPMMLDENG